MLIEISGGFIPEHLVEEITRIPVTNPDGRKSWGWELITTDGARYNIYNPDSICTSVVPAEPGFQVVVPTSRDDGISFEPHFLPVLAWRIGNGWVRPITLDSLIDEDSAIVLKDGRVVQPDYQEYESVDAFIKDFQENLKRNPPFQKNKGAA